MTDKYNLKYDSLDILIETKDDKGKVKNKELTLRRVKRANLKLFIELYDKILESFIDFNTAIAEMLIDDIIYDRFVEICKLIPVDGTDEGLDFTLIEEDFNLITVLFFSTSWDWESGEFQNMDKEMFKTSLISKFMRIEYEDRLVKILTKISQKKREVLTNLLNPEITPSLKEM